MRNTLKKYKAFLYKIFLIYFLKLVRNHNRFKTYYIYITSLHYSSLYILYNPFLWYKLYKKHKLETILKKEKLPIIH